MIYTYIYHFKKSHHHNGARSPHIVPSLLLARENNWINDWLLSNLELLFFLRAAQRLRVFDICWRGKCIYLREMKRVYTIEMEGEILKTKETNKPQPFIPRTLSCHFCLLSFPRIPLLQCWMTLSFQTSRKDTDSWLHKPWAAVFITPAWSQSPSFVL